MLVEMEIVVEIMVEMGDGKMKTDDIFFMAAYLFLCVSFVAAWFHDWLGLFGFFFAFLCAAAAGAYT